MSEPKHTPGPWEYSPDLGGHHGCCLIHAADGYLVADARLIAAAPDLLRELIDFHEYMIDIHEHICEHPVCSIQAAIDRATGVTPS